MSHEVLISPPELHPHLDDPNWALVDCRFDLHRPDQGESEYLKAHIPGAIYAHLDRDLSAPPSGTNGRHPLPSVEELARLFSGWGIGPTVQVVAYDAETGPFAARLWWILHYLGHEKIALLDGGFKAWRQAGLPERGGREARKGGEFQPRVRAFLRVDAPQILEELGRPTMVLIDARAPERYRGDEEPLDPVAGHIPGALNHFWQLNLDEQGRLLPRALLRVRFESLLGGLAPESALLYCGSGVTACHNLLAMERAGLPGARLYPGSWSEWCADPSRPIERGDPPALRAAKESKRKSPESQGPGEKG